MKFLFSSVYPRGNNSKLYTFYFEQTYRGFVNNLGIYNPKMGERKLVLSKMNIHTIQYWIIRHFHGKNMSYIMEAN